MTNNDKWAKYEQEFLERRAKRLAGMKMVETEMAKDPRIALIPASLRFFFLRDTAGEEREKMLSYYQRQADRKANQPKRLWEIWKR